MQGVFAQLQKQGISAEVIEEIKNSLDCSLYFFGNPVDMATMYSILGITVAALIGIYILLNACKKNKG